MAERVYSDCRYHSKSTCIRYSSIIIEVSCYNENVNEIRERAAMFRALGDPTRMRIFDFLRSCCCEVAVDEGGDVCPSDGSTVGTVCCHVTGGEKVTSTVSFHLKELKNAGLITIERRGRHMLCAIVPSAVDALHDYLGGKQP